MEALKVTLTGLRTKLPFFSGNYHVQHILKVEAFVS